MNHTKPECILQLLKERGHTHSEGLKRKVGSSIKVRITT